MPSPSSIRSESPDLPVHPELQDVSKDTDKKPVAVSIHNQPSGALAAFPASPQPSVIENAPPRKFAKLPVRPGSASPDIRPTESIKPPQITLPPSTHTAKTKTASDPRVEHDGGLAFPKTLKQLGERVQAHRTREIIELDQAAEVLNQIRYNPNDPAAGQPTNSSTLAKRITAAHVEQWNRSLGLKPQDVSAMNWISFAGGCMIPASSTAINLLSYLAIPLITKNVANPWVQAGLSLGVAAAQPFITAPLQTMAVSAIEVFRQKNAASVKLDKGAINAKVTQQELSSQIDTAATNFKQGTDEIVDLLHTMMAEGKPKTTEKNAEPAQAAEPVFDAEHIEQLLATASQANKEKFAALCDQQSKHGLELGELAVKMQSVGSQHDRQFWSQIAQLPFRTARSGSGLASSFIKPRGPEAHESWVDRAPLAHKVSHDAATYISMGTAMGALGLQHLMAGVDEMGAVANEHKMNMLFADVLNPAGQAKWNAGQKLTGADLDPDKMRALVEMPETKIVGRVVANIESRIKTLEAQLELPAVAVQDDPSAMERGHATNHGALKEKIAEYKADLALLKPAKTAESEIAAPKLSEKTAGLEAPEDNPFMRLSEGGYAKQTLESVLQGTLSTYFGFALKEGINKLLSPREFSAQLGQRLGQAFTFVAAGSAGATAAARLVLAILGGSNKVALSTQFYFTLGSAVLGAFSAATQYTVINIKNERRDGGKMSLEEQIGRGIIGPYIEYLGSVANQKGLADTGDALKHLQSAISASLDELVKLGAVHIPDPGHAPSKEAIQHTPPSPTSAPQDEIDPLPRGRRMPGEWNDKEKTIQRSRPSPVSVPQDEITVIPAKLADA